MTVETNLKIILNSLTDVLFVWLDFTFYRIHKGHTLLRMTWISLVRERDARHSRRDTQDVIVDSEHPLDESGWHTRLEADGGLSHVDAAEVASTAWLEDPRALSANEYT
jgi:hypothetical protein